MSPHPVRYESRPCRPRPSVRSNLFLFPRDLLGLKIDLVDHRDRWRRLRVLDGLDCMVVLIVVVGRDSCHLRHRY